MLPEPMLGIGFQSLSASILCLTDCIASYFLPTRRTIRHTKLNESINYINIKIETTKLL